MPDCLFNTFRSSSCVDDVLGGFSSQPNSKYSRYPYYRGRRAGQRVIAREMEETNFIPAHVTGYKPSNYLSRPSPKFADLSNLIILSPTHNHGDIIELFADKTINSTYYTYEVTLDSSLDKSQNQNAIPTRVTHRQSPTKKFPSHCKTLARITSEPFLHNNKLLNCKFGLWNARSMRNKSSAISDLIITNKLDILVLTETWLSGDHLRDKTTFSDLSNTLLDYDSFNAPRTHRKGGGLALFCKKGFKAKRLLSEVKFSSFEHLSVSFSAGSILVQLIGIYRPPPSNKNKLSVSSFFEEFSAFLEQVATSSGKLLITGDFNFHTDVSSDCNASKFLDLTYTFCLQQLVTGPTHISGHTLDLIFSRTYDDLVFDIDTTFDLPSDHAAIKCHLQLPKPKPTRSLVKFRKTRGIDLDDLKKCILASTIITSPVSDINDLVNQYNFVLASLLDSHAPETTRYITVRSHAPWYSDLLRAAKRDKRSKERLWRSSGLEIHRQIFKHQCKIYQGLLDAEKRNHHMSKFSGCDQRQLFKIVDKMVNGSNTKVLPTSIPTENLPEQFLNFFKNKIHSLRKTLDDKSVLIHDRNQPVTCSSKFGCFKPLSLDDTRRLTMKSTPKTCALDPVPSYLVKECLDSLVHPITTIFNMSLSSGTVPLLFKSALITPVLKKTSLDQELLSNYRPVSNLPFISKILERAVAEQLNKYLLDNHLYGKLQSAYKKYHSTETALLRVYNDLLTTVDNGNEAILVLLDLTAAFDTIDHNILVARLHTKFGICGLALKWFEDYLHLRTQSVIINSTQSSSTPLTWGVPQGSVLGPLLFTLYLSPLEDLVVSHALQSMFYADDSQLYFTVKKSQMQAAITSIQQCVEDITSWCTINKLVLNASKTETLHIASKFAKSPQTFPGLNIGESHIPDSGAVRDLGLFLDKHLVLDKHTKNVSKAASFAIFKIGRIRPYLSKAVCEKLVHAFVSSRLDSCNSLLYGLPHTLLNKLQLIQNTAARLVTYTKRHEHITPVLKSLHWLPVQTRIHFKIILLTYKALHGYAPVYITELLHPLTHHRTLRSMSDGLLLSIPRTNTKSYGDRSFAAVAPKLWNELPKDLRASESVADFKSKLKTFLFKKSFSQ